MTHNSRPLIRHHLCDNCLMPMTSLYCSQCGQKKVSQSKHFKILLGEFVEDVLNFDDKIMRTIKPLLFKPGFLSKEYFANRRMLYVSPLKLYFFISVITFFLIQHSIDSAVDSKNFITIDETDHKKPANDLAEEAKTPVVTTDAQNKIPSIHIANDTNNASANKDIAKKNPAKDDNSITFNGKPWDAKTNPINETWLPEAVNNLLNERVAKLQEIMKSDDTVNQLTHAALTASPQTLLILLPFFALLMKFVYFFQKRLYIEHLIVGLHNHAFLLLCISAGFVFSEIGSWLSPYPIVISLGEFFSTLIMFWVPVYFLLSLKIVYQQSWRRTVFKFLLIAFFYLFLLSFGLVINILLGFLLL